ncbi:YetF domain-containing protein [Halobacillus litoralis]|uniref:YetF domain-containing protein n=1 Tax=Halobacillus litoralis TaxID=45668 RepID=UPI001CFCFDA7|nr:DUF421 domain-containing protein [Halobacillus litoralis]
MNTIDFIGNGLIIFFVLYILARILTKKLISQLTLFDFIAGITLGSMTSTTFLSPDVSLGRGILALVLFSLLVLLIDMWSLKSVAIRKVFNSKPTLLMDNGRILQNEMKKVRYNVDELIAELRKKGVFYFHEVQTAVLETDGSVSVLRKSESLPLTASDLKIEAKPVYFPQLVVVQGQVDEKKLAECGYSQEWLQAQIKKHGYDEFQELLVVQLNPNGKIYLASKE